MEEKNAITGVGAAMLAPLFDLWVSMIPFILPTFLLIFGDLWFGVAAARFKKEHVRFSRMLRRTLNKVVDYVCWLSIAMTFGVMFGDTFSFPLFPYVILFIIYGIELESCYSNYFAARGINKKLDIFKLFKSKGKEGIEQGKSDENNINDLT